jgi:hypothetical protein
MSLLLILHFQVGLTTPMQSMFQATLCHLGVFA